MTRCIPRGRGDRRTTSGARCSAPARRCQATRTSLRPDAWWACARPRVRRVLQRRPRRSRSTTVPPAPPDTTAGNRAPRTSNGSLNSEKPRMSTRLPRSAPPARLAVCRRCTPDMDDARAGADRREARLERFAPQGVDDQIEPVPGGIGQLQRRSRRRSDARPCRRTGRQGTSAPVVAAGRPRRSSRRPPPVRSAPPPVPRSRRRQARARVRPGTQPAPAHHRHPACEPGDTHRRRDRRRHVLGYRHQPIVGATKTWRTGRSGRAPRHACPRGTASEATTIPTASTPATYGGSGSGR